jgi:hypothetical protein
MRCANHFGDGGARLSRSAFDNPKTRGILCVHLSILTAVGGTPALRSIWATGSNCTENAELQVASEIFTLVA